MGLLRRPPTGEIVEDGRFSRPCGPGALRAQSEKTSLRLRRHSHISDISPVATYRDLTSIFRESGGEESGRQIRVSLEG
jgi:hypothetical protein